MAKQQERVVDRNLKNRNWQRSWIVIQIFPTKGADNADVDVER